MSVLPYIDCFIFYVGARAIRKVSITGSCVICDLAETDPPVASCAVYHDIGAIVIHWVAVMETTAANQVGYRSYNSRAWIIHGW